MTKLFNRKNILLILGILIALVISFWQPLFAGDDLPDNNAQEQFDLSNKPLRKYLNTNSLHPALTKNNQFKAWLEMLNSSADQ